MKALFLVLLSAASLSAQDFPQPPHILSGNVRTLAGDVIDDPSLSIVAFADGVEIGSFSTLTVNSSSDTCENFRLEIPTSTGPADTRTYTFKLRDSGLFSDLFAASTTAFNFAPVPGGLTKIDFTPGIDSDLDTIPDSWEQLQLQSLGLTDLSLLTSTGDYDQDGLSDLSEFTIGTDPTLFESQLNFASDGETADGWAKIEFDVIENRRYRLETSPDSTKWSTVEIALEDDQENLSEELTASTSRRVLVTTPPSGAARLFYRLAVR